MRRAHRTRAFASSSNCISVVYRHGCARSAVSSWIRRRRAAAEGRWRLVQEDLIAGDRPRELPGAKLVNGVGHGFDLGRRHARYGSGALDAARIERVAERVAKQVEAQHRRADREPGEHRRPRCVAEEIQVATIRDHPAPTWGRRLNPETEERQRGLGHDGAGDSKRRGNDDGRYDVRQHVPGNDPRVTGAERADGLHVLELAHHEHLASDETRHARPADDADGEEHDAEGRAECGNHRDQQEQRGERERHVGESHHELVDPRP
jgi:hypothetical protein